MFSLNREQFERLRGIGDGDAPEDLLALEILKCRFEWSDFSVEIMLLLGLDGGVVGGFGDAGDDGVASGFAGGGIGDENGDCQAASIGESDEADVVGGVGHSVAGSGGACFVPDDRSGRQLAFDPVGPCRGVFHPF